MADSRNRKRQAGIKNFFKPVDDEPKTEDIFNFAQPSTSTAPKLKRARIDEKAKSGITSGTHQAIAGVNVEGSDTALNDDPIYSHEVAKAGICRFQGCRVKTFANKGFCKDHWGSVQKQRNIMAKQIAIQCPQCPQCKPCENLKMDEISSCDDDASLIENELKEVDEVIKKYIKPIVEKDIDYYLGVTYNTRLRHTEHLSKYKEQISATSSIDNIKLDTLMTIIGVEKASRIEQMIISQCLLNADENVRSKMINAGGGGEGLGEVLTRKLKAEYSLYVRYDKAGLTKFPDTNRFQDGNLTGDQLKRVFVEIFNMRNLGSLIDDGNDICFGVTTHDGHHNRMSNYNKLVHYKHVPPRLFKDQILISVGQIIKIGEHEKVVLNNMDIRKIEVVAITQLKFGQFSRYSKNIMNVGGGGESCGVPKDLLYFRMGKNSLKPVSSDNEEEDHAKTTYYGGVIPKNKNGLIDWSTLIPDWKVVLACGSKLKREKEKTLACVCGKLFSGKFYLERHKLICEAAGGNNTKIACEECGKLFTVRYLPDHKKLVHGNKNPSRKSKAFANKRKFVKMEKDDNSEDAKDKEEESKLQEDDDEIIWIEE